MQSDSDGAIKYAVTPLAVAAGLVTWVALFHAFRFSRIPALQDLTVWISHVAITGWLLALLLIVVWRKILNILLARWLDSRTKAGRDR
jgi:hypothetical protein